MTASLCLLLVLSAPATPQYTLTVWACDGRHGGVWHAHTWCTFSDGTQNGCISWMPGNSKIRLRDGSQPGRNWTHRETLAWAAAKGCRVAKVGTMEIDAAGYQVCRRRQQTLELGAIWYKALDAQTRPAAVNCIHAVSDLVGYLGTGTSFGYEASRRVYLHLLAHLAKEPR